MIRIYLTIAIICLCLQGTGSAQPDATAYPQAPTTTPDPQGQATPATATPNDDQSGQITPLTETVVESTGETDDNQPGDLIPLPDNDDQGSSAMPEPQTTGQPPSDHQIDYYSDQSSGIDNNDPLYSDPGYSDPGYSDPGNAPSEQPQSDFSQDYFGNPAFDQPQDDPIHDQSLDQDYRDPASDFDAFPQSDEPFSMEEPLAPMEDSFMDGGY